MHLAEVFCSFFVLVTVVKRLMKDWIVKLMVTINVGY